MLFNPYTGKPRDPRDIASDPSGLLMIDPDEPLRAASSTGEASDAVRAEEWIDAWFGSAPDRGRWIVKKTGERIAWLGEGDHANNAAEAIVAAHNAALSTPTTSAIERPEPLSHQWLIDYARNLRGEIVLYNGPSTEPYLDICGSDLWMNTSDFTDGPKLAEFIGGCLRYFQSLATGKGNGQ